MRLPFASRFEGSTLLSLFVGAMFSVEHGIVCIVVVGLADESDTAGRGGLVGNLVCVGWVIANAIDGSRNLN